MTPEHALKELIAGNARYVSGQTACWPNGEERRRALAEAQQPWACVVTCADSRVVPEILFDCHLGDLFVVRIAGTICTPEVIESVDFAVSRFPIGVVVALAHSNCGAVSAAVEGREPGNSRIISVLRPLVQRLRPSHSGTGDLLAAVSKENARLLCATFRDALPLMRSKLESGKVQLHTAFSDIGSGKVEFDV